VKSQGLMPGRRRGTIVWVGHLFLAGLARLCAAEVPSIPAGRLLAEFLYPRAAYHKPGKSKSASTGSGGGGSWR
jgi:hypothetical protein